MQRYSIRDIKNAILAHNGRNIEARRFFNMLVGGARVTRMGAFRSHAIKRRGKVERLVTKTDYGKTEYIYYQKLLQNIHIPDIDIKDLFDNYKKQLEETDETLNEKFYNEVVNIILEFKFPKKSQNKKSVLKKELLQLLQHKLQEKIHDTSTTKAITKHLELINSPECLVDTQKQN